MTEQSEKAFWKSFVICYLLSCLAFVEGLKPDQEDTLLRLVMRDNEKSKFTNDASPGYLSTRPNAVWSELKAMGLYPLYTKRSKRAAISNKERRWIGTDGRPLIPYIIEPSNFEDHTKQVIHMAMQHWAKHVPCLRFVRRTNQRSYLSFYSGEGCFSDVGRIGGRQRVSIGQGCRILPTIIHEIGHALGFWHEQSRPDRDHYVRIYWNNIQRGYRYAFHKYTDGRINSLGVPYDYDSIMHYDSTAFGQGRTTMRRSNGDKRLGNKKGLSKYDILQARLLYCRSRGTRAQKVESKDCSHKDTRYWCRYWKRKGYCRSTSSRYSSMSKNCRKTCFCKKNKVVCRDKNRTCRVWTRMGYCKAYKKYMQANCRRSCRLCR